jgi:hypothetical protein
MCQHDPRRDGHRLSMDIQHLLYVTCDPRVASSETDCQSECHEGRPSAFPAVFSFRGIHLEHYGLVPFSSIQAFNSRAWSHARTLCTMGDRSPKNIQKQEEQRHDKEVEKVHHKQENAEAQHHPVSGHPETSEEAHIREEGEEKAKIAAASGEAAA